jgi:hypothetical protein
MKIALEESEIDSILEDVEGCYFGLIRGVDDETECATLYVTAAQGQNFDDPVDVEFTKVDDFFRHIFDGFLKNAVKARAIAFTRISESDRMAGRSAYASAQWLNRLGLYPYKDAPTMFDDRYGRFQDKLQSEPYTQEQIASGKLSRKVLKGVREDLVERLETLRVICMSNPRMTSVFGSLIGDRHLVLFPFTAVLSDRLGPGGLTGVSAEVYAGLLGHSFLHELTHFLEPCKGTVLAALRKGLEDRGLTSKWDTYEGAQFVNEFMKEQEAYLAHCTRFRFALLYLTYKLKFVRKSLHDQIAAQLAEIVTYDYDPGEPKRKKDGSPKVAGKYRKIVWERPPSFSLVLPDLSTDEARYEATYRWEDQLRDSIREIQEGKKPLFVPKSEVEKIANLRERLSELDTAQLKYRQNFQRSAYIPTDVQVGSAQGVLVSPSGHTNMYLETSEEDPFSIVARMIARPRVVSVDRVTIAEGMPYLGLYLDDEGVLPIYNDGSGDVITLTLEEMWWILAM